MHKVYTAILADFISDHCETNEIITEEQEQENAKAGDAVTNCSLTR